MFFDGAVDIGLILCYNKTKFSPLSDNEFLHSYDLDTHSDNIYVYSDQYDSNNNISSYTEVDEPNTIPSIYPHSDIFKNISDSFTAIN